MSKKIAYVLALFFVAASFTASAQLKGDPWIFKVYQEAYNRQPTAWELNIRLYNNGSWNNYNELKKYVQDYQQTMAAASISFTVAPIKAGNYGVLLNQNGTSIAASVISNDGGSLVASGGGNLVASGGGNLVASGGGNLQSLPGATLGSSRQLMAGEKKIIKTSGNGAIIIK